MLWWRWNTSFNIKSKSFSRLQISALYSIISSEEWRQKDYFYFKNKVFNSWQLLQSCHFKNKVFNSWQLLQSCQRLLSLKISAVWMEPAITTLLETHLEPKLRSVRRLCIAIRSETELFTKLETLSSLTRICSPQNQIMTNDKKRTNIYAKWRVCWQRI